jgi:hypothetical protein
MILLAFVAVFLSLSERRRRKVVDNLLYLVLVGAVAWVAADLTFYALRTKQPVTRECAEAATNGTSGPPGPRGYPGQNGTALFTINDILPGDNVAVEPSR